jgi:CDP-6-deoxy-D-xylo-4-hexulose-3-dehydrase
MIRLMKNAFCEERETRGRLADFLGGEGQLSMGSYCASFEEKFSKFQGRRHSVLFNSGASANLALLQSCMNLGLLRPGDCAAFSALTWATNVMPLLQMRLEPIPVDCSSMTLNAMSWNLESRLSESPVSLFFVTNALGFTGDLPKIREICLDRNILLLEDNCESLGTVLPEGRAGNFGFASTFSFYVAHHLSTIEGGMVCTDDEELCCMLKMVRANGWDRNLLPEQQRRIRLRHRVKSGLDAKYAFYDLGYNLRPTEITGFLGCAQMEFLPGAVEARVRNYGRFDEIVMANPGLLSVDHSHIDVVSNFALPVLCVDSGIKERYVERFEKRDIEIRPIIAGNIQNQPFYRKYADKFYPLPEVDFIEKNGFYCGNSPDYDDGDLAAILEAAADEPDLTGGGTNG